MSSIFLILTKQALCTSLPLPKETGSPSTRVKTRLSIASLKRLGRELEAGNEKG